VALKFLVLVALIGGIVVAITLAYSARGSSGTATASGTCPDDAIVSRVEAAPVYADVQGSVVDPAKLHLHEQQILPLRNFVTDASKRADSPDRNDRVCALRMMREWADARAIETPPSDFGGLRELERFSIALNVIALKLRADGMDIEPLLDWLGNLNRIVTGRFGAQSRVNNLYIWSGVAAASYALLSGDVASRRYENDVWRQGIAAIRADGFVDSELRRGERALLYHVYDLSALLTLRAFRAALGESDSAQEHASLARLVERVGSSLCDRSEIATASGSAVQESPRTIEFAPIIAFAGDFASPRFLRCAPPDIPNTDPILGGRFDKLAAILAHRTARHTQ
jgi:poly(beta-D-mannuronate) lyase